MLRTGITILSLSFTVAWFCWSQLHWHFLQERNNNLLIRLSSVTSMCLNVSNKTEKLRKEKQHLAQQLFILERRRKGRKKYLVKLKKIIKERNFKFGIGGN